MQKFRVEINTDQIRILSQYSEIVSWTQDEWIEDPTVTTAIARAVKLAYTNPEELLRILSH